MAASISAAAASTTCRFGRTPVVGGRPGRGTECVFFVRRPERRLGLRRLTVCFVMEEMREMSGAGVKSREEETGGEPEARRLEKVGHEGLGLTIPVVNERMLERAARKKKERATYLLAAVMSSLGITSMAVAAVYYRFSWQLEGGDVPVAEMFGTFALSVGAAVGMEYWARWAHRALWHTSMWSLHESHHRPREGPFELNDVFAIINAVPAIALMGFGFFHKGLIPGLCFGAGLGITVFGMAYMFVHDGLVHRRFPVGPIANVPYFRRVAAAHQLHHADKFDGVPYGLFLGPKELEEVGGLEELEKEISRRIKAYNSALLVEPEDSTSKAYNSALLVEPEDSTSSEKLES